jgi:hypothetical protein
MKKSHLKKILTLGSFLAFTFVVGTHAQESRSASMTVVSATLSTPRLSTVSSLAAGNIVGATQVVLDGAGGTPSLTTDQLLDGDTVLIGSNNYTVKDIVNSTTFTVTSALVTGDADSADPVRTAISPTITTRFTTANAVPHGMFRVLVPAASSNANDGIADATGFDFGGGTPTVTCPDDVGGNMYDFVAGTASASAFTINSVVYHSFECRYSGTGDTTHDFDGGAVGTGDNETPIIISGIINPAPASGHATGTADGYKMIVKNVNGSFVDIDATTIAIGVIENVKISASVAPQITFSIAGISQSANTCGSFTAAETSTPIAVPFGELSITAFRYGGQTLAVSTNAPNGYAVTAAMNDQLGRDGVACAGANGTGLLSTCIPDAIVTSMDSTTAQDWTTTSEKGFGYSIDNDDAAVVPFEYNVGGTFMARHFADIAAGESPASIFSSTTVADTENVNVCYRAIINASQAAGNYENNVTYTATAKF